jgi:two-component system, OmpR family, response regulator
MMKQPKRILLVEDDENLAYMVKENLQSNNFVVIWARNGEEGLELSCKGKIDLYILDVMMPRKDGFWLANQLRKRDIDTPIVFLTAKKTESDKIEGFTIGADDFITKPFSIRELILRLNAIFRRTQSDSTLVFEMKIGDVLFNYLKREISRENEIISLNLKEAAILKILIENKNTIVQRRTILNRIWGSDDYFHSRSMDVYITRLRKILRIDPLLEIMNVYGTGFQLVEKTKSEK